MRYLLSVILVSFLVVTGFGCAEQDSGNQAVLQSTWEMYENEAHGFAMQYPGKYIFREKEEGTTTDYFGEEMTFLFSISDPSQSTGDSTALLYVFYKEGWEIQDLKTLVADGYEGEVVEFVVEEELRQGGMDLVRLENTTVMVDTNKTHYVEERKEGLLIFSPFLFQEELFEEMLETLRAL